MSRYYRRNNSGNAIWIFIVTLVCVAAVIFGAVFHTELGNWAKKLKDKLTEDKKQEQVEGKDDGTTVDEDWKDFYFERQSVKYGSWMGDNSMAKHCHYVFSEEKYQEIVNNENSFLVGAVVSYSKYKERVEEYGTLEKYLDYFWSTQTSWLDSQFSNRLSNLPERYVDEYGNKKYM